VKTTWTTTLTILLATAGVTLAQDPPGGGLLDATAARERAARWLRDGPLAPRPELTAAQVEALDAVEVEDRLHGPAFDLLSRTAAGRLRFVVRVERIRGRVLYFSQPDRDTIVPRHRADGTPRDPEEVAEETRLRARLDRAALRARALAFVGHLTPEAVTGARRFEVVHESSERDGLLVDAFVLMEVPGEGVLACYRNVVQLDLSPETGDVVSVRWTDLRHDVRTAPPIAAIAAERAARDRLGAAAPAPLEAPRLEVISSSQPGRPRPVWLLTFPPARAEAEPRHLLVDAENGEVIEPE
jgi:hypothetical protein